MEFKEVYRFLKVYGNFKPGTIYSYSFYLKYRFYLSEVSLLTVIRPWRGEDISIFYSVSESCNSDLMLSKYFADNFGILHDRLNWSGVFSNCGLFIFVSTLFCFCIIFWVLFGLLSVYWPIIGPSSPCSWSIGRSRLSGICLGTWYWGFDNS